MIAAGDMDGDGKADLVVNLPDYGCLGAVFLDGDMVKHYPAPATRIAVGDFNGDGKADLAGIWTISSGSEIPQPGVGQRALQTLP